MPTDFKLTDIVPKGAPKMFWYHQSIQYGIFFHSYFKPKTAKIILLGYKKY